MERVPAAQPTDILRLPDSPRLGYINVYYSALRKNYYYAGLDVFTTNFGIVATCFSLALVVYVTLEASFLNLEKLSFSKRKR